MDGGTRGELIEELRRQGIIDDKVLNALSAVQRERFVSHAQQTQAYENNALPIGHGQTISQPYIVALSTQALELEREHRTLEIGTGSGYQTAVLASLCDHVFTVERIAALSWKAKAVLDELGFAKVRYRIGDGAKGWSSQAPFDRILLTAAAASLPTALIEQLKPGGILVGPVGPTGGQQLIRYVAGCGGPSETSVLCDVRFVPLVQ